MNWAATFREIVSHRRLGRGPSIVRGALRVAEFPYAIAVGWRNRRFDRGAAAIHRVAVPVISVGNLTLGGTGKTPMVKWIAGWLRERGIRVAIVSRGYGARAGSKNDEALELAHSLPDVPHVQDRDRVAAAKRAISEFHAQVIVADDAFQHRRLARDLEIVLLDALEPFGFEYLFPRGTLREPVEGLQRAAVVCLTRSDMVDEAERRGIEAKVRNIHPQVAWCAVAHRPTELLSASAARQPLATLVDEPVAAFCGIGNPAGFRHTLAELECQVVAWREFPDHHTFTTDDVTSLGIWVASAGATMAICTHKDLVKLGVERLADVPLWAVTVDIDIRSGGEHLERALEEVLARARAD